MTRPASTQSYPNAPLGWSSTDREVWNHLIASLQRRDIIDRTRSNQVAVAPPVSVAPGGGDQALGWII